MREDFLNRIKNMTLEKEPLAEGEKLTDEFVDEKIVQYRKMLNSEKYNELMSKIIDGEER